ncbi:M15 family metallopeptidase [Nocardioides sp. KIGAM211]|uniref:M15 family metallopeptidase n=1 Tax=Nocardioides luti TaxID=2761101 RepID=A0A7X0V9S6_9ACTN|nr:M15 family metallopeptidase [Nocardioides luti]MBB6626831.1 M15 family metallopeptidase [Nocardioides luti]
MHLGPLGRHALALLLAVGLAAGLVGPARAAEPVGTTLALAGSPAYADTDTPLTLDLLQADGAPVAAASVLVERRSAGAWVSLASVTTDDAGHAELPVTLSRTTADNTFRATYAGDELHTGSTAGPVAVALERRTSVLRIGGPSTVVDEQQLSLDVRWRTAGGDPVAGRVRIYRKVAGGAWRKVGSVVTGDDGRATYTSRPRSDTRWQARVDRLSWVTSDRSPAHAVDNLPPGERVVLPRGAPRPRVRVPVQPHAVGDGPNIVVRRVPNGVWSQMTGRTWHQGCPVGRASLRYVRINYWDYSGYRRRGEFVANADAAGRIAGALAEMYNAQLPIRSMYRADRFGWSARLGGANDYRSMAAGNTSVFNCRDVVNSPGVRSPHSYGRALDLNTWENPYRSARGTVPNTWWQPHEHPRVAWRSRSHRVVAIMARHGLRWTYGLGDTQHFDAVAGNGRFLARPTGCESEVCE